MASSPQEDAATAFDPLRPKLIRVAYRMLGSVADAEDMVQEAFIRWMGADRAAVREPEAFLRHGITCLFNRLHRGDRGDSALEHNMRGFSCQVDAGAGHARQGAQRLFDTAGAGGAAHPGDGQIEALRNRHDGCLHSRN